MAGALVSTRRGRSAASAVEADASRAMIADQSFMRGPLRLFFCAAIRMKS